jgi:hypothetical protein
VSTANKLIFLGLLVMLLAGASSSFFVNVHNAEHKVSDWTVNSGELMGDVLVGQTFQSYRDDLSAVGVMFATYLNRENTEPV